MDKNGWIPVNERLPEHKEEVLGIRGNRRFVCMFVGVNELEADFDNDDGEYNEQLDCYFCPEGWYEQAMEHDDVGYWRIDKPTHWQQLPEAPVT